MTKFAHFRDRDFAYVGGPLKLKGGCTAAYFEADGVVTFSVARCNDNENFNRKIGRAVAEGRLLKGKQVQTVTLAEGQTAYEAIVEAL